SFTETNVALNAGLTKSFRSTDFALNYNRGHQFNGYITNSSTDRIDLINSIRWTRRIETSTSVAYFRTPNSSSPQTSGTYATEQVTFGLTRSLSLSAGVSYIKQPGDGVYVQTGNRRFASAGITWAPSDRAAQY